jgi:eukaryotic-like serine/threonine-protein kinase
MMAGQTIGPYSIVAKLGEGGMGEVYRARDPRLHRDVALKLLPPTFATDPDRLARFTREAQTLAALNHPNIAQIYGLDETATGPVLVIELVEGETLAERISRDEGRGLPLDEALAIARQIAEALEAAHERGSFIEISSRRT